MTPVEDYKPQTLSCKHIITPAINHKADFVGFQLTNSPRNRATRVVMGAGPAQAGWQAGWQAGRQAGTSSNHSN